MVPLVFIYELFACQVWNFDKLAINCDYFIYLFILYEIPL